MALAPGARLGPYEILSPLGAGRMGEVYRAKDTKLDRLVAIKVLPSSVAGDPDRLARFEREAKAVAADRVRHMFYSPDGRWLYFQPNHLNIYRMPADGGPEQQVTNFPESGLFFEEPTITPDGRYLVYCRSNGGSSLWVLQLGNVQQRVRSSARKRLQYPQHDPASSDRRRILPAPRAPGVDRGHMRSSMVKS